MVSIEDIQLGTQAVNLTRSITILSAIVIIMLIAVISMQLANISAGKTLPWFGLALTILILGSIYIRYYKYKVFINGMTHDITINNIEQELELTSNTMTMKAVPTANNNSNSIVSKPTITKTSISKFDTPKTTIESIVEPKIQDIKELDAEVKKHVESASVVASEIKKHVTTAKAQADQAKEFVSKFKTQI